MCIAPTSLCECVYVYVYMSVCMCLCARACACVPVCVRGSQRSMSGILFSLSPPYFETGSLTDPKSSLIWLE